MSSGATRRPEKPRQGRIPTEAQLDLITGSPDFETRIEDFRAYLAQMITIYAPGTRGWTMPRLLDQKLSPGGIGLPPMRVISQCLADHRRPDLGTRQAMEWLGRIGAGAGTYEKRQHG